MKTTLLIITLFISAIGHSQAGFNGATGPVPQGLAWGQTDQAAIDFFTNLTSKPKKILTAADIQGTPYFTEEFKLAKVFYGGRFEDGKEIYIRHNAYSDELEMATSPYQYASEQILIKTKEVFCEIEGITFKLLPYISKSSGQPEIGYLQSIFEGEKYSVYLNQTKVFMKQQAARTSLERSFPPRFVDSQVFYYSKEGETPKYLNTSKGSLKKLFKDKVQAKELLKTKGNDLEV
ncbi:MAG: hypothetical protein O3B94_01965, partial [Bacteroidetes bacterium]|nr:hypothetical protein [Bacteroidota bacterium]